MNRLREYRLKKRITLKELSQASGYSIQHINLVELGKDTASKFFKRCIAEIFGVSIDKLFPINSGKIVIPKISTTKFGCYRQRSKKSLKTIAMETGYTRQYLYLIEKSRVTPSIICQRKLAKCLNVSIDKLFLVIYG
ncbi:MAG: helix-turn-helix domain-containing protein [Elusimicrobiota bacterium]